MSKNKKTVPCGGFAFTEEKDMKKLSDLAKEGWILDSFKYLSYQLKKSEPEDVIYCIDYNDDKNDISSYLEIFQESEWKHVCSYDCFHFFKAKSGASPIYTDSDTRSLKYKRLYNVVKKGIKYVIITALAAGIIANRMEHVTATSTFYESIKFIAYMVCSGSIGLTFPLLLCNVFIKKKIVSNKLL